MLEVAVLRIENGNNFQWIILDVHPTLLRSACVAGSAERLVKRGRVYAARRGEVVLSSPRLY